MKLFALAWASLLNRRLTAILTILAIAVSAAVLLSVERVRQDTREGFLSTVNGVDLLVGARTGSVQLLLYSVFHIGNATNNLRWDSYTMLADDKRVAWSVPISLGDSHKGFRVIGTTPDFFQHYKYAGGKSIEYSQGQPFAGLFQVVLGAEVARTLGYKLNDEIIVAHGAGKVSFAEHKNNPFKVVAILQSTGTPIDRSVLVSVQSMEAIHKNWSTGSFRSEPNKKMTTADYAQMDLTPTAITAVMVGLHSKTAIFSVQRAINNYQQEPLTAIIPGVALQELWSVFRLFEGALFFVAIAVAASGLFGMVATLLAGMNERRREMAILRALGAGPLYLLSLSLVEVLGLLLAACSLGVFLLWLGIFLAQDWLLDNIGLPLLWHSLTLREWYLLAMLLLAGLFAGLVPAWRAYRQSLSDGLMVRL
jgi:putative ABC transport system permease protein